MMKKLIPFYFVNVAYQQSMYVRFILHANISVGTVNCASKARIPRIFLLPECFSAVFPGKNVYLLEKISNVLVISGLRKTQPKLLASLDAELSFQTIFLLDRLFLLV